VGGGASADPGRSEAERGVVDRLRAALERVAVPHPLAAVADTQSRAAPRANRRSCANLNPRLLAHADERRVTAGPP
jgi:hypothetical protein